MQQLNADSASKNAAQAKDAQFEKELAALALIKDEPLTDFNWDADQQVVTEKYTVRRGGSKPLFRSSKLREKFSSSTKKIPRFASSSIKPKADIHESDLKPLKILGIPVLSDNKLTRRILRVSFIAAGIGIAAPEIHSLLNSIHNASSSAAHDNASSNNRNSAAGPSDCNFQNPMLVETALGTFFETDSNMCRRILEAVPAPSLSFTQYNKNIAVRALQDGSFEFRLVTFKAGSVDFNRLLKEHARGSVFGTGKIRQAYMDAYRFVTHENTQTASDNFLLADHYIAAERKRRSGDSYSANDLRTGNSSNVQRVIKFREQNAIESYGLRPISAQTYRAVIGGWLISPLPYSFYLAKWNRESGFDSDAQSGTGSARGLNQFTIATFLYAVKKYGVQVGLNDLHARVMTLATYQNSKGQTVSRNDKDTVRDPRFVALFREASINPSYSTALGVLNTASKIENLQADVDSGAIRLPEGRTRISEVEGYMAHYLGRDANRVINARLENPHALMIDVVPQDVYARNQNDFENITVEDYFVRIGRKSGFGNRTLDVSHWFKDGHGRNFATNITRRNVVKHTDIGTRFRIVANETTAGNVLAVQTRPNVSWIQSRHVGSGVEPIVSPPVRTPG